MGDVSGVSTKHVVLGLLVERPGYGYDLGQRLDARLSFLRLPENAVYRVLDRLEEDGLIEEIGERRVGRTRRGAARVMYAATSDGQAQFKRWIATPSDRSVLRDELQAKLALADPEDLPELLAAAEAQARECLAELATLERLPLDRATASELSWSQAANTLVEDFRGRWLQMLVDWLEAVCVVLEERIERGAARSASSLPRLTAVPRRP
ncbi:MAG TPA: PadR family transcriptional regulator [Conexibacter sp.]|jgi:DNA-binding PadR family transcriptional regulator